MSIISIGYNNNITHSINDALKELDIKDIISDKIVAIKPNETYATQNNIDGATHGDTLQAVIRYIKKYNPKKIVVSGGAGATDTNKVLQ
jgi:uncharacterized protein (DUF362 family)